MSETTPEATATDATEGTEPSTVNPTETVEFWRSKAREQERRAKENAAAAKRLAEIEEQQKSAEQREAERLNAAERRAADAEARALRLSVALSKGLPVDLAERLRGDTEDDLLADAEQLLSLVAPKEGAPATPVPGPRPDMTQGRGSAAPLSTAEMFAAAINGQLNT